MTPERLAEIRYRVYLGYNLLAAEAREVFAHYGEPIQPLAKRCEVCEGEGCEVCGGEGTVIYNHPPLST